ncbi:unnamed protein product [Didymodactylos carnosus]|nr:unnamed protein product [Didymodactylos carnosus]CAF3988787.1 unnamed protein product [Didymodactylos carnosus]
MNNEHEYFMENYSSTSYQQTSILSSNKHYQHREEKNIYQSTTLPFTYELEQEHNDIEQATKIQKNVNPYFDRIAAWLENTQILNEDIADLPFIDDNNNDLTLADNFIQQQQTTNNKGFYQTSILNNNHLSDIFGSILPHDYSNITSSKQLDQTNRYGNEIKMKQSSLSSPSIRTDKPKRSSSMITTTHQHQPKQTTSTAIVQTLTPTSSFSSIILTTGMNDHDLLTTPVKKLSTEINRRKTIATVKDYSQQQNNHRHSRIDDNNRIAKSQQQQRGLSINNQENFSTPTIVRRRRIIDFSRRRTVATTSSSTTDINNNNKENLNDNKKQSSLIRKDSLTKPTIIKQHGPTNNVSFSTSTSTSSFPKSDKKQPVIELIQPPSIYKFTSSPLTQLSKKYYFNNNNATTSSDNESMVDDESMSFYGLLQNSDYSKNGPKNRNSLVMVSWQAPQQQQHSLPMSTYNTNNNNDIPPSKNLINFQMISEYNNRSNKSHSCSISSPSYQSEQLSNNDLIDDLLCDREVESYFYPNSVYSSYADYSYEPHQQYPHIYINVPPHQQIAKSTKQNMPSAIINLPDYYGTLC